MPFRHVASLKLFQFNNLMNAMIDHGVVTRRGGASEGIWSSLNIGSTVGDSNERVEKNKELLPRLWEPGGDQIHEVWQIHSTDIVVANGPSNPERLQKADAIVTNKPGLSLVMRFADCVPVLLWDPINHAVGIVHAGWKGTVNQVSRFAVETMSREFGTSPSALIAGVGPSIGPDHYEVGDEVVGRFEQEFGEQARDYFEQVGKGLHLNLWQVNQDILRNLGVDQIETAHICTACHLDDWYSHRAEKGRTGRFGAFIRLKDV